MNPAAGLRSSGRAPHTAYDDIVARALADRDVRRLERHYEMVAVLADSAFARREVRWIELHDRRRQRRLGTVR